MSNNPYGPPPPGQGYPRYPPPPTHAPGAFAYIPAPVMMPMPMYQPAPPPPSVHVAPEPGPTYVTNYIYNQTEVGPGSVQVAQGPAPDEIDWVSTNPTSAPSLSHRAFVGGHEGWDGSPLWVIRSHLSGDFIPGKLAVKHRAAYVPHAGKEVPVHNFEVLLAPPHALRWLPASNGEVPVGAYPAGNTHTAEPLYIGRTKHLKSVTPGKVHPSHRCLYISFGGKEIAYKNYEVLCKIVG